MPTFGDWCLRDCLKKFHLVSFGKIKAQLGKDYFLFLFFIREPVVKSFVPI